MIHRGIEITEYLDGRSGVKKFKARFQYKNQEYTPKTTSLEAIKKEINRIFSDADAGLNPKIDTNFPFVDDVLKKELASITDHKKKTFYERVYSDFLSILPPIRIDELTQADFSAYCDLRLNRTNPRSEAPIKNATINKELSAISVALVNAKRRFRALHNFKPIQIEKLPNDYERRRRTVKENEFDLILAKLYEPRQPGERINDHLYRVRLGHWIEFEALTGLRRKEIAILKPENYDKSEKALVEFLRPKTDKVVAFFPLPARAAEIVEERLKLNSPFIFTDDGKPIESHYRKLKNLCTDLNIKYGSFTKGGFVLHDLRRNFATEMIRHTDIETAREFLGHADLTHTGIYLTTDKARMKSAVRKFDGIELKAEIKAIVQAVKDGESEVDSAVKKLLKIIEGR
jgi:integrase